MESGEAVVIIIIVRHRSVWLRKCRHGGIINARNRHLSIATSRSAPSQGPVVYYQKSCRPDTLYYRRENWSFPYLLQSNRLHFISWLDNWLIADWGVVWLATFESMSIAQWWLVGNRGIVACWWIIFLAKWNFKRLTANVFTIDCNWQSILPGMLSWIGLGEQTDIYILLKTNPWNARL